MNKSLTKVVEGNWDELKGKLKKHWGKLSDDDITQIGGSYDKLVGKLKKAYGYADDKIIEQVKSFLDESDINDVKDKFENGAENIWENAKDLKDRFQKNILDSYENIKNKSIDMEEDVVKYIKTNPVKSVLFTALAGAIIARLFNNKNYKK